MRSEEGFGFTARASVLTTLGRDMRVQVRRGVYRMQGRGRGTHLAVLYGSRHRILERAETKVLRVQDLGHSFASGAMPVGKGLPKIGKRPGHDKIRTTAGYAYFANDPVKSAANRVPSRIAKVAG